MQLYPYQERVKELLLSGKSVILQAPTGAGKTRAALAPFIEAFFDRPADFFPRKCIYSVPMRVLANQFFAEYHELAASYERIHRRQMAVSIQTGDRPDDPKLQSNLIFCTIDQTLSSFLNVPYTLGRGSANLNAGAILSSYLVFDELHLYDPDSTLPTTLAMLRKLKDITPFIIMTATFSSTMIVQLADLLGAVVVPEDPEQRQGMQTIGSQVGKDRRFYARDQALTAQAVLNPERGGRRVMCICNTVAAAQQLYREIKAQLEEMKDGETQLCLLHSRFYKEDRDNKEKWIKAEFGKAQNAYDGPPLILVATQVIEVGVDATCDVLHTEMAPASSLLQRAGRCARRENESGRVFIYQRRDEEGQPDYTPYHLKNKARQTERGLRLCLATWEALNTPAFTNQHMSFSLEQKLIDQVHKPVDQEILQGVSDARHQHWDKMLRVMSNYEMGLAADLIRYANNHQVIIHPNPESDEELAHNPWFYNGFSFDPGVLRGAFKRLQEQAGDPEDTPWIMKAARRMESEGNRETDEAPARRREEYGWFALNEAKEASSAVILAVHPSMARYDTELGFTFGPSSDQYYRPHPASKKTGKASYSYQHETYAEHIAGLYHAYTQSIKDPETGVMRLALGDEIAYAAQHMESRYNLSPGAIDQMLRAVLACHDLGKLNRPWQDWAHRWQQTVGQFYGEDHSLPEDYMAAHTDFDNSKEQREHQKKVGNRPRHAGESAMAASGLLEQLCDENGNLWLAGMSTIARHHTASVSSYQPYRCHPAAQKAFAQALEIVGLPNSLTGSILWEDNGNKSIEQGMIHFQDDAQRNLYLILCRILRLSDQRSQLK